MYWAATRHAVLLLFKVTVRFEFRMSLLFLLALITDTLMHLECLTTEGDISATVCNALESDSGSGT